MKLTLVAGPPCAGKTTYITERALPGDLVVSYDALSDALSVGPESRLRAHPFTLAAFYGVLNAMRKSRLRHSRAHVWVEQCAPKREQRERYERFYRAEIVVLETPVEKCLSRALARFDDPLRLAQYEDEIHAWWQTYDAERTLVAR